MKNAELELKNYKRLGPIGLENKCDLNCCPTKLTDVNKVRVYTLHVSII